MPADFFLKAMNAVHKTVLTVSGGNFGWDTAGMPVLKLTTTGRKSGQEREVMLTSPYQDGDTLVIVASRGGDDQNPAWFLNLRDEPNVTVETKDQPRHQRTARVATAAERTEVWPQITSKYKNYADYQNRTDREIPLVFLEK